MNRLIERLAELTYRQARRVVIFVIGFTVLLVGVVMIVMPGPAFIVIPLGLAILGIEFAWARYWLKKIKAAADDGVNYFKSHLGPKQKLPKSNH